VNTAQGTPLRFFIADLHLDGTSTQRALNFREFLSRLATYAQERPVELYIIGDLFEFWYEYRSALFELYRDDLSALEAAWKAGVKIFLFFGNRDFAYGNYATARFGATVLGDGQQITLGDYRPLWMEHGDLLCRSDTRYLRFRKIIRSWPVKCAFFLMPWSFAKGLIENIRKKTNADKAAKPKGVIAIDEAYARQRLEEKKCKILLCGHTHVPQQTDLGAGYRLIVLPPWCDVPAGMVDDGRSFKAFQLDELK
jgi:UDP-2,3-diacylglucosamine hydrolase